MKTKKKTILIISPNFLEPTAWMISAYKTALALAKYGKVKVIVLTSKTKGSKAYETMNGVQVHRTKSWYIADPVNYAITPHIVQETKKLIKRYKPDHILLSKYMFFPNLIAFYLRFKKIPYTVQTDTFPGYCWFKESKALNAFLWVYTRTIGLLILKMAKQVILLHEGLIKPAKSMGLKRTTVIHNGVDREMFNNAKPASDIINIKKGRFLVTYMGRLDEVKGYRFVLDAAERMKEEKDVQFLFVCGNKYPEKRKRLQKKYPYITFMGFRKDVAEIFKASDAHVLASVTEGLPNSVLEAMAAGCKVITTPVGAIPYFIKDGENGIIIEQSASSIIEGIHRAKKNNQLQKNALKTIKERFDWKELTQEMLKTI